MELTHRSIATGRTNLAVLLRATGRAAEAEALATTSHTRTGLSPRNPKEKDMEDIKPMIDDDEDAEGHGIQFNVNEDVEDDADTEDAEGHGIQFNVNEDLEEDEEATPSA